MYRSDGNWNTDQEIQSNLPQFDHPKCEDPSGGGGGGGALGSIFAGYVPLASQSPNQIIVYSAPNYRPHLSHFLFLWIDPFFRLNEEHFTFHLQYKHSGTFAPEELFYPKKFDPILFWKEVRTLISTLWKIIVHCNFWVAICVVVCCR